MRALAMAAAVALMAGQADAGSIYDFTFITDAPHGQQTISLDLLSLANVDIDQTVDMVDGADCSCGYFSAPIVSPLIVPSYASASFRLRTDGAGKILDIGYYWSEDFFAWSWGKNSFTASYWGDGDTSETYAGYWQYAGSAAAEVPVPASAIALLSGLFALAGWRHLRALAPEWRRVHTRSR